MLMWDTKAVDTTKKGLLFNKVKTENQTVFVNSIHQKVLHIFKRSRYASAYSFGFFFFYSFILLSALLQIIAHSYKYTLLSGL